MYCFESFTKNKSFEDRGGTASMGQDSLVSIVTCYRLDVQRSNPGEDGFFTPVQTSPGVYPASCTVGPRSLSWGSSAGGMALTTHSHLALRF